ncbi:Lrp/AsnC family transcriptional regulator [Sabulicella glaciei]|uniref:Lrp/AsnC family transcriptional regulator n=1 Tax=Sabulicella glaciei TaxID=2984948 RepID=A0ABT3P0C8_9PROT|nr:Lrp/AsnC family transcriptional regulator [Roseococcus sp. MDT2-1-1]MCW8087866.1 Lrp/AsnC family transcriptional regulator [Roseococcus sp. MDT2-1-1]
MDEIDRKILLAVQADGAAGLAEIAKVAGLSVSATAERQKRLEERGLIRGWHAALDPALVGVPLLAFLRLDMRPGKEDSAFRRLVRKQQAVLECHQLTGEWSYLLKLRVPDISALDELITEEIRPLPGLERLSVEIALASVKESGLLPIPPVPEEDE